MPAMLEPSTDLATMISAARTAGTGLMRRFRDRSRLEVELKGLADFVSTADLESEETLKSLLLGAHPLRGFYAEEGAPTAARNDERYIVDPLDGTTNFLQGIPHFAVSVALERRGEIVAGVVFDPAKGELFWGERERGAWLGDGARLRVVEGMDLSRAIVSTGIPHANRRQRHARYLPALAAMMREAAGIRRMGAAALDLAYVAAGRFAVHFETGLAPWDVAAGALLIEEAGGRVSESTGGRGFVWSGDVVATNLDLHQRALGLLRRAGAPRLGVSTRRPRRSRLL